MVFSRFNRLFKLFDTATVEANQDRTIDNNNNNNLKLLPDRGDLALATNTAAPFQDNDDSLVCSGALASDGSSGESAVEDFDTGASNQLQHDLAQSAQLSPNRPAETTRPTLIVRLKCEHKARSHPERARKRKVLASGDGSEDEYEDKSEDESEDESENGQEDGHEDGLENVAAGTRSAKRKKRNSNWGKRVKRKYVGALSSEGNEKEWWYLTKEDFKRLKTPDRIRWHHIGRMMHSKAGEIAETACERCHKKGLVCRVYTEKAVAAGDNLPRVCARCVRNRHSCNAVRHPLSVPGAGSDVSLVSESRYGLLEDRIRELEDSKQALDDRLTSVERQLRE